MDKYTMNLTRLTKAKKLIHLAIKSGTLYSPSMTNDCEKAEFLAKASLHLLDEAIIIQRNYLEGKL